MFRKLFIILVILVGVVSTGCSSAETPPEAISPGTTIADGPGNSQSPATGQAQPAAGNSQTQTTSANSTLAGTSYTIVDTGQSSCYDDASPISCPQAGTAFFGQDAQYAGVTAAYRDNGDGTVSDLNTGLMWQQVPDFNKVTWDVALANASSFNLGGYDDWRLPTIKELYSLMDFNGSSQLSVPYIDTSIFAFEYGDGGASANSAIDGRYWSSTAYVGTVFGGMDAVFGVNFADGRIKGYGLGGQNGREIAQYVRYVRGNPDYGTNSFVANGDGTVTDVATGLSWMQTDSVSTLNWNEALAYCENLTSAGYDDWRLPNAKELHSLVDYSRAPTVTGTAAIDPIFSVTEIESWYWTSTTLLEGRPEASFESAAYIAFGQAYGVQGDTLIDVHGAGAQRSDPKSGDPANYAAGRGTTGQDDQVRIYNYARCVRAGGNFTTDTQTATSSTQASAVQQPPAGGEGQQPPAGNGNQLPPPPGNGGPPPSGGGQAPPGGG